MKTNQLTKLMAIGTIATGIAAVFSATPARAASFNGGEFNFNGATSDFATQLNSTIIGRNFAIIFNPGTSNSTIGLNSLTVPSGTNGSLSERTGRLLASSTVNFTKNTNFIFTLVNPLSFVFPVGNSGTRVDIAAGSRFIRPTSSGNVNLSFEEGSGITTIQNGINNSPTAFVFTFNIQDQTPSSPGTYAIAANIPTPVPEPLTVIGTIIGGAAALRMRKKLSAVSNN